MIVFDFFVTCFYALRGMILLRRIVPFHAAVYLGMVD